MFALQLLLETLPEALVSESTSGRLLAIGDQFPDALTGRIGLEARLHNDSQVDLLLLASTARQLRVLADTDPVVSLSTELAHRPPWRAAARLARRSLTLIESQSPLPPAIWLEIDGASGSAATLVPGLFAAAAPDGDYPGASGWDVADTVEEILATAAGGRAASEDSTRWLAKQVREIAGTELTIRQVGFFPGRAGNGVRLFCAAPAPERLVPELSACGWDGPADALERWTAICAHRCDSMHVSLDVTPDGVLPEVGIEVSLADTAQPRDDPRWGSLLAILRHERLCTSAKAAALGELGRAYEGRIITRRSYRQGLHHIKVTVAGAGTASAKAYFGAYEVTAGTPVALR
jgi:hypothetical protein